MGVGGQGDLLAVGGSPSGMSSRGRGVTLVEGRAAVDSRLLDGIGIAFIKGSCVVVSRLIPAASESVVDVLAVLSSLGVIGVASSEAEEVGAHEVGPLVDLPCSLAECIREDKPTDGVAIPISSVRVQLSSIVPSRDVHLGKVSDTGKLDVMRSLDEVRSSDGSLWNDPRPSPSLGAPSDLDPLRVPDLARPVALVRSRRGRSPEAEIGGGVDKGVLAHRVGVRAGSALVGAALALLGLVGGILRGVGGGVLSESHLRSDEEGGKEEGSRREHDYKVRERVVQEGA